MSVGTALNNFTQSVAGIFYSLLNAVLAIFHAVLALGVQDDDLAVAEAQLP